jgi:hypothetical protein
VLPRNSTTEEMTKQRSIMMSLEQIRCH